MENLFEELIFTLENIGYHRNWLVNSRGCPANVVARQFTPSYLSPIRWVQQSAAVPLPWTWTKYLLNEPFASIDRKSRIKRYDQKYVTERSNKLLMGRPVILCDHDLSDYKAYIDHMVELRRKTRKCFVPSMRWQVLQRSCF